MNRTVPKRKMKRTGPLEDDRRSSGKHFQRLAKMETSSSKDFAYAMNLLRYVSWPVGTWPLQDYNVVSALRSVATISVLMIMLAIVHTEIYLDYKDAEKILDALVIIACGILAVCKVAVFRVNFVGLVSNFVSAAKDYKELNSEKKRAIMRRHAYMGRTACFSVICFSYCSATLFTAVSMLATEEKEMNINASAEKNAVDYPIPSENTLKMLNVPGFLYPAIFCTQYFMLLVTSTGNLGSDALFFGITFHLCGQAEVLKQEFIDSVNDENTAKRFDELTRRHQHLLNLSVDLNNTISLILIIQLFVSCVLICTSGFQFILSLSVNNFVMVIKTFIVASTLLTQMFAYSYVGDYLQNQMEGIGYSAYCCSWYSISNHLSKNIVFIIQRSQYPVQLKAWKCVVVNMETYMSIMKTSMSYLSVLRVMVNT